MNFFASASASMEECVTVVQADMATDENNAKNTFHIFIFILQLGVLLNC